MKNQLNVKGPIYGGSFHIGDIYQDLGQKQITYGIVRINQAHIEECLLKIAVMLNLQLSQYRKSDPFYSL